MKSNEKQQETNVGTALKEKDILEERLKKEEKKQKINSDYSLSETSLKTKTIDSNEPQADNNLKKSLPHESTQPSYRIDFDDLDPTYRALRCHDTVTYEKLQLKDVENEEVAKENLGIHIEEKKKGHSTDPIERRLKITLYVLIVALFTTVVWIVIVLLGMEKTEPIQWIDEPIEYGNTKATAFTSHGVKVLSQTELDPFEVGQQTITVTYRINDKKKKESHTVTVKDTQKPVLTIGTTTITTLSGELPDWSLLDIKAEDPVDGPCMYSVDTPTIDGIGTYDVKIIATDKNGNQTTKTVELLVLGEGQQFSSTTYASQVKALTDEYNARQEEIQKQKEEYEKQQVIDEAIQSLYARYPNTSINETSLQQIVSIQNWLTTNWDISFDGLALAYLDYLGISLDAESFPEEQVAEQLLPLKEEFEKQNINMSTGYQAVAYVLQGYNFNDDTWYENYSYYSIENAKSFYDQQVSDGQNETYGNPTFAQDVLAILGISV